LNISSEPLPRGIWDIVADGHRGELNIISVQSDGQLTGTARFDIKTKDEYIGNIFGFWDDIGWKITFLREHQVTFKDRGQAIERTMKTIQDMIIRVNTTIETINPAAKPKHLDVQFGIKFDGELDIILRKQEQKLVSKLLSYGENNLLIGGSLRWA
jgi:hypothetical protein